ncbi:alpha/beta hydrolase fold protein [[Ruminococcus] torques]|uniref:Alpha/beta hydrolase fold protein n=1 Tax=[Ruminococcus] torques TaxID=33039 RepID=A0A564T1G7_9FIRM|nr:alpha/beta hydrolase [[Ruminococcus] torques]VUX00501.1 alpha/beta hydrolase fold protein [[Ruminococcus] torques]
MKTEIIQLYPQNENVTLTSYIINDSVEMLNGKKRPAILICPGGGYLDLSDREAEPVALKFNAMGYHAFVLRYSVYRQADEDFPDIFSETFEARKNCQFPQAMLDIAESMRILNQNSNTWHLDTGRIGLCGFSAGAHNVALYCTNWNKEILAGQAPDHSTSLRPAAAILCYGLSDYTLKINEGNSEIINQFFDASNLAFLGATHPSNDILDKVSPAKQIDQYMPPTFLWATAGDQMVPVEHTIRMAHGLSENHIPFEMHIFEEGSHGLSLASQASASGLTETSADVEKWINLAEKWLLKRFALPLPEKAITFEESFDI